MGSFSDPALILPGAISDVHVAATAAITGTKLETGWQKNVASGISGLDAGVLLAIAQQRTKFFIGSFTRDVSTATGTQAITGVGFSPRLVVFLTNIDGTPSMSIGFDDGTKHNMISDNDGGTPGNYGSSTNISLFLLIGVGAYNYGVVSVLGADGFTVSWTKVGSPTGTANISYIAFA